MRINRHDTNGNKPLLGKGELGYDDYTAGGDTGRVYVGTGTENIPVAKKIEVDAVDGKADAHIARVDNPHGVTKAQVGLGLVDNTADANKNVLSATKWTTARTITLSGDVAGSASMDGTANVSITTTVQPNSVALGTDTTGNYVAGITQGTGITVSGTAGEGWSPTIAITNVGTAGTYTKVTTNAQGQVTSGTTLSATDIPSLDASKITTGTLPVVQGGTGVTTSTGTGSVVLSTSPILTTPNIGVATGTSFNSITGLSSTTPLMDGTAAVGTSVTVARADHVHPIDTSRAPLASPAFTGTPTVNGYNISPFTGFKNYIINGNFDVWRIGTSQTSDGYASDDRWSNASVISTKVHSQVPCTDVERALFNASYFSRTVATYIDGTNSIVKKLQYIENITRLAGKTVTISFWAKADSNKKMNVQVVDFYGTGGTPTNAGTSTVNFGNVDLTSTWTKYKLTATLPSLVGKTLGADGVHTSAFRLDFGFTFSSDRKEVTLYGMPGGQSGTFDIAQVQLEEGSVATTFEQRPYGLELSLCERTLPSAIGFFSGYVATTNEVWISVPHKVKARVVPTGLIASSGGTVYYGNTTSPITGIAFFGGGIDSSIIKVNPTGSPLTVGQGVMVGLPKILFTGCEL